MPTLEEIETDLLNTYNEPVRLSKSEMEGEGFILSAVEDKGTHMMRSYTHISFLNYVFTTRTDKPGVHITHLTGSHQSWVPDPKSAVNRMNAYN